ncbi:MAG: glycosyltransferase family 2 protein [Chloroflexota bacterium]|nr:glycosyltransferase family 2 protein [Chloroflexota bacterium]
MCKISIIIPHYNAINTLISLLDSIDDNKEIQTIVVDDKSDQHPKDFLPKRYLNQITLIDNETDKKGAGVCRNIGLEHACGDWVLFADADDFFVDGFYEVVQNYFDSNLDIVYFKSMSMNIETKEKSIRNAYIDKIIDTYLEKKDHEAELVLRYRISVPWAKLINRNFIEEHQIRFDEVIASNDVMFSTKVGYYMENFAVSNERIYCVTRNQGNLTMKKSEALFDSRFGVFIERCKFLQQRLTKKEFSVLRLAGFNWIIVALSYKLGLRKAIEVYSKLRENKIKLFGLRYFDPVYQIKKLIYYWRYYHS